MFLVTWLIFVSFNPVNYNSRILLLVLFGTANFRSVHNS